MYVGGTASRPAPYLVVLVGFKVGQRSVAGSGEGHDLHSSVD